MGWPFAVRQVYEVMQPGERGKRKKRERKRRIMIHTDALLVSSGPVRLVANLVYFEPLGG